jgi:ABC-type branched-subunit amino acid transport system substrate-binding protein
LEEIMKSVRFNLVALILLSLLSGGAAVAAEAYDPGASKTEVKLGQTVPYSGPASAYAIIPRTHLAYFKMLNDKGGINGRKINLISLDDGYSPPKTVEGTRRLVEQEQVLAMFGSLGTPTNSAVEAYLNQKKVPQIIYAGATRFADPAKYPWSISFYPSYAMEGSIFARYLLATKPTAKVGILYQNDDSGRDYVAGFKKGLGDKAAGMIVGEASYSTSDTTVTPQLTQLKAADANAVFNAATPRFAAQSIRGMADLNWKPLHMLTSPSSSVKAVIEPAGAANAVGVVTAAFMKTAGDPLWANDQDVKDFVAFAKANLPNADPSDFNVTMGYVTAEIMAHILDKAGDDLTRKRVMDVATHMESTTFPMLLPGITISTSPTKYQTYNSVRLEKFDGAKYQLIDQQF